MAQYIYGKNSCIQRIQQHQPVQEIYLDRNFHDQQLLTLLKNGHYAWLSVDREFLKRLCGSNHHQGIVIKIDDYPTLSLTGLIQQAQSVTLPLLVMLDHVEDPHNVGAVLRCCDAAGAQGIILAKNRSAPLNATVAKVSTGAIETVPVAEVTNLSTALDTLKQSGYWIYGAEGNGTLDYRCPAYDTPVVLVIGSEGKGLSSKVKSRCDQLVYLPMRGSINSLNASVACGILLYAIQAKRFPFQ